MTLHTVLFSSTIVVLIFSIVSYRVLLTPKDDTQACRMTTANVWFEEFMRLSTVTTLVLIIYVSYKLCTPLSETWQQTVNSLVNGGDVNAITTFQLNSQSGALADSAEA